MVATFQKSLIGAVREVVGVLDAGDLRRRLRRQVLLEADVAESDRADQSVVAHRDHRRQLVVEGHLGLGMTSQVHNRDLLQVEADEVRLDSSKKLLGALCLQPATGLVPGGTDLGDDHEVCRIRVQGFANQFVRDIRAVELRGVDVVHPGIHRVAQNRKSVVPISRGSDHARSGQLHRPEAHPVHGLSAEHGRVAPILCHDSVLPGADPSSCVGRPRTRGAVRIFETPFLNTLKIMSGVRLVRITDEKDAGPCQALFEEYGDWSSGYLASDYGIVLSKEDLDRIHASFQEEWPLLLGDRGRMYLAISEARPAGVGALMPVTEDLCEIKRMFVRPEHRKAGLGRLILEQLLTDASHLGYDTARLETMTYMKDAQALYRAIGFVDSEPFAAEGTTFGVAHCELFMTLDLGTLLTSTSETSPSRKDVLLSSGARAQRRLRTRCRRPARDTSLRRTGTEPSARPRSATSDFSGNAGLLNAVANPLRSP